LKLLPRGESLGIAVRERAVVLGATYPGGADMLCPSSNVRFCAMSGRSLPQLPANGVLKDFRPNPQIIWGRQHICGPNLVWLILLDRLPEIPVAVPIVIVIVKVISVEIEHIEQVSDCRHVDGNIGIVIVGARIGQIIAAALAELAEIPIPFDEFHKGRMFTINVRDVTAP
jgi:hypothetical protein